MADENADCAQEHSGTNLGKRLLPERLQGAPSIQILTYLGHLADFISPLGTAQNPGGSGGETAGKIEDANFLAP